MCMTGHGTMGREMEMVKSQFNIVGVFRSADGEEYKGEWAGDKREGEGNN